MNQYYAIASSSRLNVVAARWPHAQLGLKSFWNRNFTKKVCTFKILIRTYDVKGPFIDNVGNWEGEG